MISEVEDAINPSHESTRTMFRKIVLLWELARIEGHEDSTDGDGISLEMFVSSQLAILALKGIYNPSEKHIQAIRRATREFEDLLDSPELDIVPLDLEAVQTFEPTEHDHFRFKDGQWQVRTKRYGEDEELKTLGPKLEALFSEKTKTHKKVELFVELATAITNLLWQDYAKLGYVFYCNHYSQPYEDNFGIWDYRYEDSDYFIRNIGTPSWAEVYVDWVDISHDRESNWNEWGEGFLENINENSSLLLLYAWETEISDQYVTEEAGDWYWPKVTFDIVVDPLITILQLDRRWYFDADYFNIIEFGVNPDVDHIRKLEIESGVSYDALSSDQIGLIVDLSLALLDHSDIGSNKVVHYILSLVLNHPKTSEKTKTAISQLNNPHIGIFDNS